jgi:tetratricopeptide (TPR) repeat protein
MFRRGGIALWVLVVQLAPGPSLAADQCSLELLQANAARAAEVCTLVLNADETTTASRVAALKIRGRAMQRLDRYPDAIADYETGLRIAPDDAELHLRRGWTAYEELRRGGGSYFDPGLQPALDLALKQAAQALRLKPDYPDAYRLIGVAFAMAGPDKFAEAKAAHDEAIRLDPNNPEMWFSRLIMLEENRRFHEAIQDADVILRLPADLITKPRAAESYLKSTTHRIATAIKRAEMLRKLGRTNEAWQAYNMAAELDPDPITYSRRAEFRLSQIGFFPGMPPPPLDAVQADLDKALALDPDYWVSHEQRGYLLVIREQYDAAATEFALALKQYPENGGLRWSYALALRKLGRSEEAAGQGITAFRMDRGFMFQKLGMLRRLGYLAAIAPDADPRPAIMDAARACMLDERCG